MEPWMEAGPDGSMDASLLDALVRTSFNVIGVVTAVAARHDLSLTLLRVGAILRDRALTMSELATYLGLDRSTMTGLIGRAAERGIVLRVGNPADKRSSRVTLTEDGHLLATACAAEISRELEPLVAGLAPAERVRLTRLLEACLG